MSGFEVVTVTKSVAAASTDSVNGACPTDKKALAASGGFAAPLATLFSQVTRVDDSTFQLTGLNTGVGSQLLTLDVTCVTALP